MNVTTTIEVRRCFRCQGTEGLRLVSSVTVWNPQNGRRRQQNTYVCINRRACSERAAEATQKYKEADLWANYHQECRRPRRYTPRKYWKDGRRLTFAAAQILFSQAGHVLEKGQPDFPEGIKSGYIVDRMWRFTSLLEAIKMIEKPKRKKFKKCPGSK